MVALVAIVVAAAVLGGGVGAGAEERCRRSVGARERCRRGAGAPGGC